MKKQLRENNSPFHKYGACEDKINNLNKIFTRDGTVHISSPEIHRGKVLKIYHLNDLFNIFPYYDFGENYRENDQNDSLQSSY